MEVRAEDRDAAAPHAGAPSITADLAILGALFEDIQRTRISSDLRAFQADAAGNPGIAMFARAQSEDLKKTESRVSRELKRTLARHELYPWLSQYKGLAGPTTARLLGIIANPHRFPGLICEAGHHLPDTYGGEVCPAEHSTEDGTAGGRCLAPVHPRRGSGVASLWHYSGLHVVNGKLPMHRKGVQADWNPAARVLCLGPNMLADQIIKLQVAPYVETYYATKERLQRERGAVDDVEAEGRSGSALASSSQHGNGVERSHEHDPEDDSVPISSGVERRTEPEVDHGPRTSSEGADSSRASDADVGPLRPIQIHKRARTVAVKRFVGDLLMEWKQVAA